MEFYMNKKIIFQVILVLIISVVVESGCKIRQRNIYKEPIKEQGADYLFNQLKAHELKYKCINAKLNAEFNSDDKSHSFQANLRIIKDSAIWISISPALGIELVRILISNDSIKLLNRFDNTYLISDFNHLNRMFDTEFDFDILQALITGNDVTYYENDKFKAAIDNKKYLLKTFGRRKIKKLARQNEIPKVLLQDIWLNHETFKIEKLMVKELKENRKLEVEYLDFKLIDSCLYPSIINFSIHSDIKTTLNIEYRSFELSDSLNLNFNIPRKYKPMP